ncbi:inositol-1,4,5-triphosphate receptor, partial [Chrysochromulina tobinii]
VKADLLDGSRCAWTDQVRLRHVGTDCVLSVVLSARSASGAVLSAGSSRETSRRSRLTWDLARQISRDLDRSESGGSAGDDSAREEARSAPPFLRRKTSRSASRSTFLVEQDDEMVEPSQLTNLRATRVMRDEDVFGLVAVERAEEADIHFAKDISEKLRAFWGAPSWQPCAQDGALAERAACDFKPLIHLLSELIVFVTSTDEIDPLKREGLPIFSRQTLLREQGVVELVLLTLMTSDCLPHQVLLTLTEPFKPHLFAFEDLGGHNGSPSGHAASQLKRSMVLALRLCRHLVRDNSPNKRCMVSHVPLFQSMLSKGLKAAQTLRECFADNVQMLDLVTDELVDRFVQLIREAGRETYFVEFLMVLCECQGKAVRHNQWRVCRLLMQAAPELLLQLRLTPTGEIAISGDPRFFPTFHDVREIA